MEDTEATLTGTRHFRSGSGFMCGYTAICALGHLNDSMVPGIFMGSDRFGHR